MFFNKQSIKLNNIAYEKAYPYSDSVARVRIDNKIGYINTKGECVIQAKFIAAKPFNNKLAAVYDGVSWRVIDKKGNYLSDQYFDNIIGPLVFE